MIEATDAAIEVLAEHHGDEEWLGQLADMLKEALQRGIDQLGHAGPGVNAQPFADGQPRQYAMGARNAQQAMAEPAANSRDIGAAPRGQRVARANQAFDRQQTDKFADIAKVQDATKPQPKQEASDEWLM